MPLIPIHDIENLKALWRRDPCWPIEDTEDFESVREELLQYRLEYEKKREAAYQEKLRSYASGIGLDANLRLAESAKPEGTEIMPTVLKQLAAAVWQRRRGRCTALRQLLGRRRRHDRGVPKRHGVGLAGGVLHGRPCHTVLRRRRGPPPRGRNAASCRSVCRIWLMSERAGSRPMFARERPFACTSLERAVPRLFESRCTGRTMSPMRSPLRQWALR